MKVLGIAMALMGLAFSVSAMAAGSAPSSLTVTSLSDKAEKIESEQVSLIRSKDAFSSRADAAAFCKSQNAVLANHIDILAVIILNNSADGKEINSGLNQTANYTVIHNPSGQKQSGFISWLSDDDQKDPGIRKGADVMMMADGSGFDFESHSMSELTNTLEKSDLSFDKRQIVAFCKK